MEKNYLYLENYAFLSTKNNKVLIKNTISNGFLIFDNQHEVELLTELNNSNTGSIEIDIAKHAPLINKIKNNFSGDVLLTKKQPVQLNNALQLSNRIKITPNKETPLMLEEITVFLNGDSDFISTDSENYNRQYSHHCIAESDIELNFKDLRNWLNSYNDKLIGSVVLTGANSLTYSNISELIRFLNAKDIQTTIVVHLSKIDFLLNYSNLENLVGNTNIEIIVEIGFLEENLMRLKKYFANFEFTFLITSVENYTEGVNFIENSKIENFKYLPIYNKKNIDFFKENLFTKSDSVLEQEIAFEEIIFNHNYNLNFINRLVINSDGSIFANVNFNTIGSLKSTDIQSIIVEELKRNGAWRITRKSISPCKDCFLCDLCTPITNYEFAIGEFNTCDL